MKKVKNQLIKSLRNCITFLELKSIINKNLLKVFLVFLFILFLNVKVFSPTAYIDKREIGERCLEVKREIEIREFNKRLKEEHPHLYVLAMRESALTHLGDTVPNYNVYNKYGYIGAWQINVHYLPSLGIHGVTFEEFKEDPDNVFPPEAQLYAVQNLVKKNIEYLGWYYKYYPGKRARGVHITEEGMIYAAHLGGSYGLKRFLKYGNNPRDVFGTSIKDYLDYQNTFWYKL
jgi:hypothetical protein